MKHAIKQVFNAIKFFLQISIVVFKIQFLALIYIGIALPFILFFTGGISDISSFMGAMIMLIVCLLLVKYVAPKVDVMKVYFEDNLEFKRSLSDSSYDERLSGLLTQIWSNPTR